MYKNTTGKWCCQFKAFSDKRNAVSRFYTDESPVKEAIIYDEDCLMLNIWTPVGAGKPFPGM